ncbi:MAG: hypothetical protein WBV39_15615 [Rudaea sp.]
MARMIRATGSYVTASASSATKARRTIAAWILSVRKDAPDRQLAHLIADPP